MSYLHDKRDFADIIKINYPGLLSGPNLITGALGQLETREMWREERSKRFKAQEGLCYWFGDGRGNVMWDTDSHQGLGEAPG